MTNIDPASPESCWNEMRGFHGQFSRGYETGVSDVVRLFDLLRSTVQFLESHPPRSGRVPGLF